jgi:hypothetical protein
MDVVFIHRSTEIFVSASHTNAAEECMDLSPRVIEDVLDAITEKY